VVPDSLYESDVHEDESGHRSDTEKQQIEAINVQVVVEWTAE